MRNIKVYPTVVFAFENHLKWKSYSNNVETSLLRIHLTFLHLQLLFIPSSKNKLRFCVFSHGNESFRGKTF